MSATPWGMASSFAEMAASTDCWTEIEGPIGPLYVAWGPDGVTEVEPAGDPGGFELLVSVRLGRQVHWVDAMPESLIGVLMRAIRGETAAGPALDLGGRTPYEAAVLRATMSIPSGEVRPYAWVAREAGRPRAVRAVGSIMAGNALPYVIPCHRVVKTDGHVGEFGAGGPAAKRALLREEGLDPDALDALADAGFRYLGDPASWVFCYPTCHVVRAVAAPDRVRLRSGESALAAGFTPCTACRPLIGSPFAWVPAQA